MRFYSNKSIYKKSILTIIILTIIAILIFGYIVTTFDRIRLDYVALGDSLAAGVTPYNTIDKGYPDFIAAKLKDEGVLLSYNNYGVSGYTTTDVLNIIDSTNSENAGRISAISVAEIITLDIGANDLLSHISSLVTKSSDKEAAFRNAADNIQKIITTLKNINPDAKIYIMGYYNAFGYLPKEIQSYLSPVIIGFNSELKVLADEAEVTFIDTYEAMDKDLTLYLPEANIHPSISGYSTIANEFWDKIKNDLPKEKNFFQRFTKKAGL